VVYLDPTCPRPVGINPLRSSRDWNLATAGIVSTFKKTWDHSWGPRLEYILFATVAALSQAQNTSLLGISRMLYDERYREWVVRQIKDPMIRSFWINEFELYDSRFLMEVVSPVQNKAGQIFFSPPIRNMLGQVPSKVDFRFMMDHSRIFIANLSKAKLGEEHSSLLASLLVSSFEMAALSRADIPIGERRPFMLFVDEFHNAATTSFASILSESRKYRLCLCLAHQYVGQLEEMVSDAVFGNVGSIVAFRVGEADADVLVRQFGAGCSREQLAGLNNFEFMARCLNGEPFRGISLPPISCGHDLGRLIRQRSRQKYGTKKAIVEERIDRWLRRRH
jgi:hypothetical protein